MIGGQIDVIDAILVLRAFDGIVVGDREVIGLE